MKVGVCIVTCDRPLYLHDCIASLQGGYDHLVVVDNGRHTKKDTQKVTWKFKGTYINGNKSNSPHGQNLGLHCLAGKGCDAVLKSDDDLFYDAGYLKKLVNVYEKHDNVGGVGGVCWDKQHSLSIHRVHDTYFLDTGEHIPRNISECIMMFRADQDEVIEMRHLYGAFLYDVKAALELEEKTKNVRGGAFGEYFSVIAFREETEFSFLIRKITGKQLYFATEATCYHYSAPGGIRVAMNMRGVQGDEPKAKKVFERLGLLWELQPMMIRKAG